MNRALPGWKSVRRSFPSEDPLPLLAAPSGCDDLMSSSQGAYVTATVDAIRASLDVLATWVR